MNAEEWRQFQVLAGNVNTLLAAMGQVQGAVGSLQRYVYAGDKDLPADKQVVSNTIGAKESIFGQVLAQRAVIAEIEQKLE